MKIGEPKREIYVEPIQLPGPLREQPDFTPVPAQVPEKVEVPDGV